MSSIDERVVAMKFDNKAFEKNIADSSRSISDLKRNLNFDGMKKGLLDLDQAAKGFNLNQMSSSIDNISSKFSAMSVVGIAALATIATKAVDVGLQLANKFFIDPAKTGFAEYEQQINAVQTILANTQSKGTTIDQVNASLDELNSYADKTIYNFSAMTQAIGTFTVAGVSLEQSTAAVKGFSNVAALSGANATSAAGAMRQLAQGISSGTIRLQDWMSIETAGIAGEQFQEALKTTARVHGVAVDDMIASNGSFRLSLQEDWLTAEIMTETLSAMTGDLSEAQLIQMGYSAEQAAQLYNMAMAASGAAQDVKTFSQLMETLGEATGSGWAQSWRIVLGDFEEAKVLFTEVSNTIGGMIGASADARNKMLQDWKDLGGRTAAVDAVRNAFQAVMSVLKPVQEAFREVFPPMTGQRLYEITVAIRDFTASLILGEGQTNALKQTLVFIFTVIKTGLDIIGGFIGLLVRLFAVIFSGGDDVNILGAQIGEFFAKMTAAIKDTAWVSAFFSTLGDILVNVVGFLKDLAIFAGQGILALGGFATGGVEAAFTRITERIQQLGMIGQWFIDTWNGLKETLKKIAEFFQPVTDALNEMFADIGENIQKAFTDVDFNALLDLANVGLLGGLVLLFKKFMKDGILGSTISEGVVDQLKGLVGSIDDILGSLTGTLEAMQQNLQAGTLMKIAGAIAILAAAVLVLSLIDSAALTKALTAITVMFTQLMGAMAVFAKIAAGPAILQLPSLATGLILVAIAINIMAAAVAKLGELTWEELLKGLAGVTGLLLAMAGAVKLMEKGAPGMIATGIGLIAIAVAVKILASAVQDFSGMDWGQMTQGLIGVAGTLVALGLFSKIATVSKGAVASGVGLILIATAIKIIASAVNDLGTLDMVALIQGLIALNVMLGIIMGFLSTFQPGPGAIKMAVGLILIGAAIKIFASAVGDFASMDFGSLATGLLGMAAALAVIVIAMNALPPTMLASAAGMILIGVALKIIASALGDFGGMSWEEIGKGLVVLAGSLLILVGAMYLASGALAGAAAILVISAALMMLTPAIMAMSSLSWDEIGRGLVMLAGVFGVIGLAGLVLTPIIPAIMALGVAIGLIGLGIGAAGVGLAAVAVALTLVAAAGLAAIPVIVALFTAVINLIPLLAQKVGEGIVAIAGVIGESMPVFFEAAVALISTILQAIITLAPQIADTILVLIEELLRILVTAIPQMVDAGMKLIIGILDGISKNIGKVIDKGAELIVNLLDGLGRNISKIIQAGIDLVIDFIEGFAQGIRNNTDRFIRAGNSLFKAIVEGVSKAIENGGNLMRWAGEKIGNAIIEGAKNALGINSPSKVFRDYIMGAVGEGIDDGAGNQIKDAMRSGASIGDAVVSGTKSVLQGLRDAVSMDMDFAPTIAPVLDLSDVKNKAATLNGLLAAPSLRVDDSYAYATSLAVAQRNNQNGTDDEPPTTAGSSDGGNSPVTFIQNNYSPKAISAADAYRNTQNAISTAMTKKELKP